MQLKKCQKVFKKNSKNKIYEKCNVTKYIIFQKMSKRVKKQIQHNFNIGFSVGQ